MAANSFNQRNDGGWCECSECGRVFGGLSGFDAHRVDVVTDPYDWRCATDAELATRSIRRSARRWWIQDARFGHGVGTQTVAAATGG